MRRTSAQAGVVGSMTWKWSVASISISSTGSPTGRGGRGEPPVVVDEIRSVGEALHDHGGDPDREPLHRVGQPVPRRFVARLGAEERLGRPITEPSTGAVDHIG